MNLELIMHNTAVRALGLAIFHSLWQAVIVFCLLQTILFWMRRPANRYRALYFGLCTVFVTFLYTFFEQLFVPTSSALSFVKPETVAIVSFESKGIKQGWWQYMAGIQHSTFFLRCLPLLTIGYALGIVLMSLRTGLAFRSMVQLRKQVIAPSSELIDQLHTLQRLMHIRKKVQVYLSTKATVPAMLGFLKPVIILALAMVNQLDRQQVEAILLHELSHIRRNDYLFNVLQMVMETFLFFNPIIWWLAAAIRKERELACGDTVLRHMGNPMPYAQALLRLEEARLPQPNAALALSGNTQKHFLFHRIKRITNMNNKSKQPHGTTLAIAAFMVAVIMTGFFVAGAQDNKKKDEARKVTKKTTTTHSTSKIVVTDDEGNVHTYDSENDNEEVAAAVTKALQEVEAELQQLDGEEIKKSLEAVRTTINTEEVQQAMKEASEELKKVNWTEVENTLKQSLTEVQQVDWDAIGKNLDESIKSLDGIQAERVERAVEELKKAIEEMSKAEGKTGFTKDANKRLIVETESTTRNNNQQEVKVQQSRTMAIEAQSTAAEAYEKAQREHKLAMKKHKVSMRQHEKSMRASEKDRLKINKLLDELKNRNLVADTDNVRIEMNNGALYINGKKQSDTVYESIKHLAPRNGQSSLSIRNSKSQN